MAASQGQRRRDAPVAEDQELPRIPFAVAPELPPTALQSQGTARRVRLFVFGNPDIASRFEGRTQHSDVGHDDISPSATESSDSLSTGSGGVEKKGQSSKTPPSLASIDSQDQDASSVSLLASVRCRCSCKGKCKTKRKPGKDRGCECKTEGVACNENCKCNRKKCENQVGLDQWFVIFWNYGSLHFLSVPTPPQEGLLGIPYPWEFYFKVFPSDIRIFCDFRASNSSENHVQCHFVAELPWSCSL